MDEELRSIVPSALALGVLAVAALVVTLARGPVRADGAALGTAVRFALGATLVQALHFGEELATGFQGRFPELFGLAPMPLGLFVSFNLVWIAIWGLSALGLARGLVAALFPLWFLGIACVANGIVHPALALRAGGYFPGLATAPLALLLGVLLVRSLLRVTPRPRGG